VPSRSVPLVTRALILINALAFFFELGLPAHTLDQLFYLFGIVPTRFTHPDWAVSVGFPAESYWSSLTHQFLHGGWLHIIANMWTLWIFGDNVEDRMGPLRFAIFPAASIIKVARQKPIAEIDDQTLILADQAEKALAQMESEVSELLADNYPLQKAAELAKLLATGTCTYNYPLTFDRARELGLPVRNDMPETVLHLMQLYPQPIRRQPSVEYLPVRNPPRRARPQSGE
jgi:hypothetical protein